MRSKELQDELQAGFETTPLPAPAPDGTLALPPMRRSLPQAPRLCAQGPCVHYHRLTVQLDAESARAAAVAAGAVHHGRLVGAPSESFHTATHHYCYPEKGIEADLGALPVLECNLWLPLADRIDLEIPKGPVLGPWRADIIYRFMGSEAGERYARELAAWKQALAAEERAQREAEAEAQRLVADLDAAEIGGEA